MTATPELDRTAASRKCPSCAGSGHIPVTDDAGSRIAGIETCRRCAGTGVASPPDARTESAEEMLEEAIYQRLRTDPDDPVISYGPDLMKLLRMALARARAEGREEAAKVAENEAYPRDYYPAVSGPGADMSQYNTACRKLAAAIRAIKEPTDGQ